MTGPYIVFVHLCAKLPKSVSCSSGKMYNVLMKCSPKLKHYQPIKFNVLSTIYSNAVTVHINGN